MRHGLPRSLLEMLLTFDLLGLPFQKQTPWPDEKPIRSHGGQESGGCCLGQEATCPWLGWPTLPAPPLPGLSEGASDLVLSGTPPSIRVLRVGQGLQPQEFDIF